MSTVSSPIHFSFIHFYTSLTSISLSIFLALSPFFFRLGGFIFEDCLLILPLLYFLFLSFPYANSFFSYPFLFQGFSFVLLFSCSNSSLLFLPSCIHLSRLSFLNLPKRNRLLSPPLVAAARSMTPWSPKVSIETSHSQVLTSVSHLIGERR